MVNNKLINQFNYTHRKAALFHPNNKNKANIN